MKNQNKRSPVGSPVGSMHGCPARVPQTCDDRKCASGICSKKLNRWLKLLPFVLKICLHVLTSRPQLCQAHRKFKYQGLVAIDESFGRDCVPCWCCPGTWPWWRQFGFDPCKFCPRSADFRLLWKPRGSPHQLY